MSDDIKKGLMGITVDETEFQKLCLRLILYLQRLCSARPYVHNCDFEEVAYLNFK